MAVMSTLRAWIEDDAGFMATDITEALFLAESALADKADSAELAASSQKSRKARAGDLLVSSEESAAFAKKLEQSRKAAGSLIKDTRMQGQFGDKKFIKP